VPTSIKPEDQPVVISIDQTTPQTSYVVTDIHGVERARFYDQVDANEFINLVNKPEGDIGVPHELPRVEQLETVMAALKKKKSAVVKRRATVKKRAASVKKVVKKVMKRRKKKAE
jgi:hypothetical protein